MLPIIIPSYEPDERLIDLLDDFKEEGLTDVVLVDDGSGEEYQHLFDKARDEYGCVVLKHAVNQGKGRALKTAFNFCLNEYPDMIGCITADSDGQHSVSCIKCCMDALVKNPGALILGVRDFSLENVPWKSRFGNTLTSFICKYLEGVSVSDTQTGLRGISTEFMKTCLNVEGERFEFETRMLIATKGVCDIFEVPIETIYDSKENHQSHFNPVKDSIRVYKVFQKSFTKLIVACVGLKVVIDFFRKGRD